MASRLYAFFFKYIYRCTPESYRFISVTRPDLRSFEILLIQSPFSQCDCLNSLTNAPRCVETDI
jgi:hypothetical protein